jgi:hypothetical protein
MDKRKIFLIIGVLILFISVVAAVLVLKQQTVFKLGAQTANKPENIQVTNITEQGATIVWTTQKAIQSLVSYGVSPNNLTLIQPESAPAINHQVNLSSLLPATNYFFVIKVEDKTFDNNGQPYTFTTKPKEVTPIPSPTQATSLTEEGLEAAMGTSNTIYDLNKDGIVNTIDLLLFRQENK